MKTLDWLLTLSSLITFTAIPGNALEVSSSLNHDKPSQDQIMNEIELLYVVDHTDNNAAHLLDDGVSSHMGNLRRKIVRRKALRNRDVRVRNIKSAWRRKER
mmetsp:Transcript_3230/g.3763  ORF Transcript_3230/g.3763 Transcript_3230/m.3763 type:complete len:102 (-) Transcript_3230:249-554(-)